MKKVVIPLAMALWVYAGLSLSSLQGQARPKWFLDVETGGSSLGYCDVRIPGDSGTRFSLTDDLQTSGTIFIRFRVGLNLRPRHTLWVLIAPLSLEGSGILPYSLDYNGITFPAFVSLRSGYRFNSYRLSYRYSVKENEKWRIGVGLTAKIRDAGISIAGGGLERKKNNVGLVPLLNFLVEWRFSPVLSLLFEGDALAAPQGRAEDVFVGVAYRKGQRWALRAGYRILEGGADNAAVYNFALVNYLSFGASYYF
jgi:hypothetical protein